MCWHQQMLWASTCEYVFTRIDWNIDLRPCESSCWPCGALLVGWGDWTKAQSDKGMNSNYLVTVSGSFYSTAISTIRPFKALMASFSRAGWWTFTRASISLKWRPSHHDRATFTETSMICAIRWWTNFVLLRSSSMLLEGLFQRGGTSVMLLPSTHHIEHIVTLN